MASVEDLTDVCLAFDLDGTLVDTASDLIGALNATLKTEGLAPVAESEARHLVGRGARALIENGLKASGLTPVAAHIDPMLRYFMRYYAEHIADTSRPFDGCVATLERLKSRGARLCVCTNKPQALSDQLLGQLGIDVWFEAVFGADAVPMKKPDPGHLGACAKAVGLSIDQTLLIGDSETDHLTSRAAGRPSLLFTFGYSDPPVTALDAEYLMDSYDELEAAIGRALGHRS